MSIIERAMDVFAKRRIANAAEASSKTSATEEKKPETGASVADNVSAHSAKAAKIALRQPADVAVNNAGESQKAAPVEPPGGQKKAPKSGGQTAERLDPRDSDSQANTMDGDAAWRIQ